MELRETPEQRALRSELRAYFATLLPEQKRRAAGEQGVGGDYFREVVSLLGKDGWLGIGWPVEYGGQGRSIEEQFIFFDEVQRAGLPFPFVTVNTVGPTLMAYGTEEQKRKFLPGILAGDIVFAIGYTEPEAGATKTYGTAEGHDPGTSVLVAKWWAADGGQRVVHRTQHVHGGIGVDTDYPVHRHLLWGKQIAATLGGASSDPARLGAQLAAGVEVLA